MCQMRRKGYGHENKSYSAHPAAKNQRKGLEGDPSSCDFVFLSQRKREIEDWEYFVFHGGEDLVGLP